MADVASGVRMVRLPADAEPPFEVYVNGERLAEGTDFRVEAGELHFSRPLRRRPPLGAARKVMLAIGIGVYGDLRGDQLDVRYTVGGRPRLLTGVDLSPAAAEAPPPG